MIGLDEMISIDGDAPTTLRSLAKAGLLVVRKSGSYRRSAQSESEIAWFADLVGQPASGGIKGWEISETTYAELQRLGVTSMTNFD